MNKTKDKQRYIKHQKIKACLAQAEVVIIGKVTMLNLLFVRNQSSCICRLRCEMKSYRINIRVTTLQPKEKQIVSFKIYGILEFTNLILIRIRVKFVPPRGKYERLPFF